MYSYLLKYCYKKPCTHEYISSTTEYFSNINQIGKKVNCISGLPSSVSNAPHLSFSDLKKSGLLNFFRCQNQKIVIFMLKMNKLEDLKVLRRSPDLLNNVKIGQGQLQPIMEQILFLPYTFWSSDLNNLMNNPSNSPVISEKKMFR